MPKIRIPLFDLKVSPQAKREVAQVLNSGWVTTGPTVERFEKAVARRLQVRYAAAMNSGTAGLKAALMAAGAGPGLEVITSPFTFVATISAILSVGARPVLADIDPVTLNLDPDEVERKLSTKTAVIMPVELAGCPSDYDRLRALCDGSRVSLISDAAHAFGASFRNKSMAQLADAAVYSFYSTKNLTCGEGGLVASRHKAFIEAVRTVGRHGLTSNAHLRRKEGGWQYDALAPGLKANMSDIHAAVGLGQLETFDADQKTRYRRAQRYLRQLSALTDFVELPAPSTPGQSAWHLFIVKLKVPRLRIDRNKFIQLMARRGIECGVHFQPIFELTYYRGALGLSRRHFPNAAFAGRRVVSLPLYPKLKVSQVDEVCTAIGDICRRYAT